MTHRAVITVRSLQRRHRLELARLRAFAERAHASCLQLRRNGATPLMTLPEIHVTLVSDRRMSALHQQFMNIAGSTDVLTFEHGEIIISVETAAANAEQFHTSTDHEVRLYLVHGLLHLHGYDDTTAARAKRMHHVQERILAAAFAS